MMRHKWASARQSPHLALYDQQSLRSAYTSTHYGKDIEDIYCFDVNTINIVIEYNVNISIFTSANVFITRDETFLWYPLKKSKLSFYFIAYRPTRVSDVIINVTKQNMNVMARMFSA